MKMYSNPIKVIEVKQKIGTFYLAKIKPSILKIIANKSLSRYKNSEGIQRDPNPEKIVEIKDYIRNDPLSTFPNTIIVSLRDDLDADNPSYKFDNNGDLLLLLDSGVANVIDGQHRLAAFDNEDEDFDLPVSIFLDLSIGEQAKIFAIINSTQTKVSLDLVYEDFFQSSSRSLEKVSFYIVKNLNEDVSSPWFGKIKTLSDRKDRDLAQGSMAKFIHKKLLSPNSVFSGLYNTERDKDMYVMLKNYFSAIKEIFPVEWKNDGNRYILTKTTGFVGFMMFFIDIISVSKKDELTSDFFKSKILPSKELLGNLTNDNYPSGAIGQRKLRNNLNGNFNKTN